MKIRSMWGWAQWFRVVLVCAVALVTTAAEAVTFRDPSGDVTMEVTAPSGTSICFLRPTELFAAADCPGISPAVASNLDRRAAFAAYFFEGDKLITVIGLRQPQPMARRWSISEGQEAVRGFTASARSEIGRAAQSITPRFGVQGDLQVLRVTAAFPPDPSNADALTLFASTMFIGRDAIYSLQVLGTSGTEALAERVLDVLTPQVAMAAPAGVPLWTAEHPLQASLNTAAYRVGQLCGSSLCGVMVLALFVALYRRSQGRPVGRVLNGLLVASLVIIALSVTVAIVRSFQNTQPRTPPARPAPRPSSPPPPAPVRLDLSSARRDFQTRIVTQEGYERAAPAPRPPRRVGLERTTYRSPVGELVAYITPIPADGRRRPAVVWAHGGFGGIGSWLWEGATPANDQTAQALRTPDVVVFYPSWRGENDNPGQFEMFYGEVDDLLAAAAHVAALPGVDPTRVYLAGHSSGATLVLLAATASERFRAAFAFGPWVGIPQAPAELREMQVMGRIRVPFDVDRPREASLRSAVRYITTIRRPTFLFEGEREFLPVIPDIVALTRRARAPFSAFSVPGGDHFNILRPLTRLLAERIARDTEPECNIQITDDEVAAAVAP